MKIVVALWRGQIPLARTAWFYGGVLLVALVSPVVILTALKSPFLHSPLMIPLCVLVLLYAAFIAVANLEAAIEYSKSGPKREANPEGVKLVVWTRDGGACVRCGSKQNLHFDHIIPSPRAAGIRKQIFRFFARRVI